MNTKEFVLKHDIFPKLEAAIHNLEAGQSYDVLKGIEQKGAIIQINYDGVNLQIANVGSVNNEPVLEAPEKEEDMVEPKFSPAMKSRPIGRRVRSEDY